MRAVIILEWREEGILYKKRIRRTEFLKYLINISENFEIFKEVKALAKEADFICVDADRDDICQEKNLIFKYAENIDFNEDIKSIEISQDEKIYYFIKSYCQEVIVFKVMENNQLRIRSKSKQQMIAIMQSIKKNYPDNNEISTKMCDLLPDMYSVLINEDRNNSCPENPIIVAYLVNETKFKVINIKNSHKIIWAHIKEWCQ